MNIEKFTQKSIEAIQNGVEITKKELNPEMGQEHLLNLLKKRPASSNGKQATSQVYCAVDI